MIQKVNHDPIQTLSAADGSYEHISMGEVNDLFETFKQTIITFNRLGLGNIFRIYVRRVVSIEINHMVNTSTKAMYENPILDDLIKWVRNLDGFFDLLDANGLIPRSKIVIEMKEAYARSRSQELFAIINDYPDSLAAIKELKDCMKTMKDWIKNFEYDYALY